MDTASWLPGAIAAFLAAGAVIAANLRSGRPALSLPTWDRLVGLLGLVLLVQFQYRGLFASPPERMMGEVARIMYVHVPVAWLAMLTFAFACLFALAHLLSGRGVFDLLVEATVEVGIVLAILTQIEGMLFARPTWGVYWTWDARLVSTAVMTLAFMGVLSLRGVVSDPEKRATWTSVTAILATSSMVVTYMSVQWWRSIHQMQSTPETVSGPMKELWRANAVALLLVTIWLVVERYRLAEARAREERAPPLPEAEVT